MRRLTRAVLLLVALTYPSIASADAFYDTYQGGLRAFKEKDYSKAREVFLRAYDMRPEPILLYNIAQTYRLESNPKEALVYYKRFLAESKIAEDLRREAQGYVSELEAQAKQAEDERTKLDGGGPRNPDGTPVRISDPPMNQPGVKTRTDDTPEHPESDLQPAHRPRLPFYVGGGAVVLLGAALASELIGESTYSKAKTDPDPNRQLSFWHSANAERYTAEGLAVVGVAAAGTAVWLYVRRHNNDRRVAVTPSISADRVGMQLEGRF